MKTLKFSALVALFIVGFVSLFAIPADNSPTWWSDFFISKSIAAASWLSFVYLNKRWGEKTETTTSKIPAHGNQGNV